jgi:sugar-specific transcriptional regulator TrmB
MPETEDSLLKERFEDLRELGLSQVQAHVYVVLLSLGPSLARTVSRLCHLRREDTYRALRFLKTIGLVEVTMDKPYTFAAVEPKVGMRILLGQLDARFDSLKKKALQVGEWLEGMNRVTTSSLPEDKIVFKIEGGTQIFERMSKLIQNCKSELVRVTSSTGISQNYVLGIFDQERQIVWNGAKIRAISEVKKGNCDILREYSRFAQLRHLEDVSSRLKFVIADDSQMIFFTTNPAENVRELGAIWTNSKPLIEAFKKEFEICWSIATPFSEILTPLENQSVSDKMPHLPSI